MAEHIRGGQPRTVVPGLYAKLLANAQRDHDTPDPRLLYVPLPHGSEGNVRDVTEEERAALIAEAKAAPPGPLLAALLADQPVVVPSSCVPDWRSISWLADLYDRPRSVRVYPDDRVEPCDE